MKQSFLRRQLVVLRREIKIKIKLFRYHALRHACLLVCYLQYRALADFERQIESPVLFLNTGCYVSGGEHLCM